MSYYYFAIASQDFLLHEEPIEEILRERNNHYKNFNKNPDFWLIINPPFLNAPSMYAIKRRLSKPSAAIVSLNPKFIKWIKLRISFVIIGKFESPSNDIPNLLYNESNINL